MHLDVHVQVLTISRISTDSIIAIGQNSLSLKQIIISIKHQKNSLVYETH